MESVVLIAVLCVARRGFGWEFTTHFFGGLTLPYPTTLPGFPGAGGASEQVLGIQHSPHLASLIHAFAPLFTYISPSVLCQPWALSLLPRLSLALWIVAGDTPRTPERGGRARQGHWISAASASPKMDARQWSILLPMISARLTVQREASTTSLI